MRNLIAFVMLALFSGAATAGVCENVSMTVDTAAELYVAEGHQVTERLRMTMVSTWLKIGAERGLATEVISDLIESEFAILNLIDTIYRENGITEIPVEMANDYCLSYWTYRTPWNERIK